MASTISAGTTTTTALVYSADTSGVLQLQTNGGTTAVTIDNSQNVGVGVTPSAWISSWKALEVGNGAIATAGTPDMRLYCNAYINSGATNTYKGTGNASYYIQNNGIHSWGIAPSGTAGNAITFTQAMTLNASGNLLLGTPSGNGLNLDFSPSTSQQNGITYVNSSPNSFTDIYGCGTSQGWQGAIRFFTSNNAAASERARIDNSGNLLVGTTSGFSNGKLQVKTNSAANVAGFQNGTSDIGYGIQYINVGGSVVGTTTWTGSATTYATSSDYRLKNTVTPMTGALAKVAALNPVTYKWNVDGSAGEGFIAHELAEVCPHAVTGTKDAIDEKGNPVYQGIDTSFLVATLTAAIQELSAQVTTLQTQVTALKG